MTKYFVLLAFMVLHGFSYSQEADSLYFDWADQAKVDNTFHGEDSLNFQLGLTYLKTNSNLSSVLAGKRVESDSNSIALLRNNYAILGDFGKAQYYHGKLPKTYRKSHNLRRYLLSEFYISPGVTTSDDYEVASPYFYTTFGISIDPISRWRIELFNKSLAQKVEKFNYSQGQFNIVSRFQLSPKYSLSFNYQSLNIRGERNHESIETLKDTISQDANSIVIDYHNIQTNETGNISNNRTQYTIGLEREFNRWIFGLNLGTSQSTFSDSKTTTIIDSTTRYTFNNDGDTLDNFIGATPISNLTKLGNENSSQYQVSLSTVYQAKWFNDGVKFTTWMDIPFTASKIGFSPYLKTQFKLTPSTWIGGWIRTYSTLTPYELGGSLANPGLDRVKLKYGGEIDFHKSRRWWIIFNLELQKRESYISKTDYSSLTLDFKFIYRLYK